MKAYRTFVFDCDGVVLNSNSIKTSAFRAAALEYGAEAANALVDYHVNHGGVSRYHKFDYFLRTVVGIEATPTAVGRLLATYANLVRSGLLECEMAAGLEEFRKATSGTHWMLVSGGDQAELKEVFAARGIDRWFDRGIFGSPDSKDLILRREIDDRNLLEPALFLGDSRYDHVAATAAGLDFAFISDWSEFKGWREYFDKNTEPAFIVPAIRDLLRQL